MKLDEHCIPTCIATNEIIPHDLMLKTLIHNKRVAMKHTISERKLNLVIRSLLRRGRKQHCDGQNDIFVISVIDLESSNCDLKSVLMAPHCYLPIEDQSCVVINEATASTVATPTTATINTTFSTVTVVNGNNGDGMSDANGAAADIGGGGSGIGASNVNGVGGNCSQTILADDILVECRRDREWSSSSVDSFFCRCNIDTVFPEDNAAIQLGRLEHFRYAAQFGSIAWL